MEVVIRPVKPEDYKEIKKYLFVQSEEKEIKKSLTTDIEEMGRNKLLRIVAETDNKVIGQCDFRRLISPIKQHIIEITGLVVNENYQGRGISSMLITYGLNWAKEQGIEIATISVRKGTKAEAVYLHMGFKVYGKLQDGIKEPWGDKLSFDEIFLFKNI